MHGDSPSLERGLLDRHCVAPSWRAPWRCRANARWWPCCAQHDEKLLKDHGKVVRGQVWFMTPSNTFHPRRSIMQWAQISEVLYGSSCARWTRVSLSPFHRWRNWGRQWHIFLQVTRQVRIRPAALTTTVKLWLGIMNLLESHLH